MKSFDSQSLHPKAGLGCSNARLYLYTPHRPPLGEYTKLTSFRPAQLGECSHIIRETGNHWRKIFSIFAKFTQALYYPGLTWQAVRDHYLFTESSAVAIVWQNGKANRSSHLVNNGYPEPVQKTVHLIGGQAFAESFDRKWAAPVTIGEQQKIIVSEEEEGLVVLSPYLDYRQFTNAMIADLLPVLQSRLATEPVAPD